MQLVEGSSTYHTEVDGDPYFLYVKVADRSWNVTKQVDLTSNYRSYVVTRQRSGKMLCECEGFKRAGKCKHLELVSCLPTFRG